MHYPPLRPALGPAGASPDRVQRGAFARAWAADGGAHPGVRHPRNRRENEWSSLTNALIGAFAGLLVLVALWSAWSASPVGKVEGWATWSPSSLPVSLRYPRGWRIGEFAEDGLTYAFFVRSTWVRIHVIAGPPIAQAVSRPGLRDPDAYSALEWMHARSRAFWGELFGEMREGRVTRTFLGGRPAVWSEFHYAGGMLEARAEPMTGYRATVLGAGTGVLIAVVAPERSWREFQPIALDVLRSVRFKPPVRGQS